MVPTGSEEVFQAVLHHFVAIHRGQKLTHRAESKARFHFHPLYENSVSTEGALCCILLIGLFSFCLLVLGENTSDSGRIWLLPFHACVLLP